MADVDDDRIASAATREKVGHFLYWFLRCRKSDARGRVVRESFQPFQRKRQVCTTFIVRDGMDLIDDYRFDIAQDGSASLGGKQDVERFRSGYQNVRRPLQHCPALMHERVAGADSSADLRHEQTALEGYPQNFTERNFEVLLDVVA